MTTQFIAGTEATPDQAQQVSDEAHAKALEGMGRWCRKTLEDFLEEPDSLSMERTELAMKAVLRTVEARRRSRVPGGDCPVDAPAPAGYNPPSSKTERPRVGACNTSPGPDHQPLLAR